MAIVASTAVVTALVAAALGLGSGVPSPTAGSTTATAGGTTVSVTIPDVTLEGPDCMDAPLQASFEEVESFATIHLAAAPSGALDALSTSLIATASGDLTDTWQICPRVDALGEYSVSGTLNTAVEAAQFAPTSFMVSKAPTRFLALSASQIRRTLSVRGRVAAVTNSGNRPAAGSIRIFGFLSIARGGTGMWTPIGKAYPDKTGAFSISGASNRKLRGMFVRAQLVCDFWCLPTMRTTRIP
jgi:hypothetical protein